MTLELLDPDRTALLVVDMQNAFCHGEGTLGISGVNVAPAQAIVEPIRGLVERCRAFRVPVLWSQQVHFAIDAGRARKRLPSHTQKRARVSALAGTWDMELVDGLKELAAAEPHLVFQKHRFGCFYETRLDAALRMLGTEALLVCGATANACVETTLREAYLRDYDVVAVTDCIAAVRPEWEPTAHAVWGQYFGVLATSDEVLAWLDDGARTARARARSPVCCRRGISRSPSAFYLGLLGLTVRKREEFRDGRPLIVTNEGLGLTSGRPAGQGPLEHLAFRARGIKALADRAQLSGRDDRPRPGAEFVRALALPDRPGRQRRSRSSARSPRDRDRRDRGRDRRQAGRGDGRPQPGRARRHVAGERRVGVGCGAAVAEDGALPACRSDRAASRVRASSSRSRSKAPSSARSHGSTRLRLYEEFVEDPVLVFADSLRQRGLG